jgi:amidase
MNGLVGLKPTLGLVSGEHVVPISHSQDTPGPMARSVADAALMLSAMMSLAPGGTARNFHASLSRASLRGVRAGVLRPQMPAALKERYEAQLLVLKRAGAVLVDVELPKLDGLGEAEFEVLKTELKSDLNAYLATAPATVKTRTLDQVIAFNAANKATEMPFFGQEIFEQAATTKGLSDAEYLGNRATSMRCSRRPGRRSWYRRPMACPGSVTA